MAMKDLSWNQTLAGPDRDLAIEAFDKELNSLLNEILIPIPKDHPDRQQAEKLATAGRALLDYKRCGTYKARIVKQGFKEDKSATNGRRFLSRLRT